MSDQAIRTSQSQKSDPLCGLNHLTFLIPLRIDTEDRLWNLTTVLRFLTSKLPGAEVILIEQDTESKLGQLARQFPNTLHRLHAEGGAFRKAKCVNEGALQTTRRFICMYDTDILINPAAIHAALAAMADGKWKMVLPFNRIFLDVYGSLRSCFGNSLDITGFDEVQKMADMRGVADLTTRYVEGGIFVADRETFLAEGGLNQKMVSYGWEDTEMFKRFSKLGYPILHLSSYNLVHLDHRRGNDSKPNEHYDVNRSEFLKVNRMQAAELARYVEQELSITERDDPLRLAERRALYRRSYFVWLLKVKAFVTLLSIQFRAHGGGALLTRLVKR